MLAGFLALLVIGGCAGKKVEPRSATILQASVQPPACPPAGDQPPAVSDVPPQRETDFFSSNEGSGLLDGMSLEPTYENSGHEPVPERFETVEDVPTVSEVVLAQYEDWRGVKYRYGGTDYRGVDCSALVQAIFRDAFEMDLPRTSFEQARLGDSVSRDDIRAGDLLYFMDRGRRHIGVAVNDKEFVHASRRKGVTISSFKGYWAKRLVRVQRILEERDQQDSLIR
jgi:cell wall-associated NlpC family hydrolase